MEILGWIEQTGLSIWLRESTSLLAFPAVLILHTVGMAFLVGTIVAISLRILGLGRQIPMAAMIRFFPVMWWGFWVNVVSGLGLLLAFPAKSLTNWVFYLKLLFIVLALLNIWVLNGEVFNKSVVDKKPVSTTGRVLAVASLVFWAGAVITGRLMAYTYVQIMSDQ